jgi:hypothetical protein
MASELFFERIHLALEGTRGTEVTTPTHTFPIMGLITPEINYFSPAQARGEIAAIYSEKPSRKGCAWSAQGQVDVNYLPVWLQMFVEPNTSPSTPGGATNSRLWEFIRDMDADDLKTATMIWDLQAQSIYSDFCVGTSLTLSNDATNTDGLTMQVSGFGHFPADIAAPTPIASIAGTDLLVGQAMQLFMDTSSAIGTTAITGRLLSAQHVITTGAVPKYVAAGPTSTLEFASVGRDKNAARCVTTLTLEVPDMTQYDIFTAGTVTKTRVRHNGALIESTFYNYVEVDTYGILKNPQWGEAYGTNRTVTFTIESLKDATLGADFRVAVENARTALAD